VGFRDTDLTQDRFLGGRLTILQPIDGYRAATDPVFLAASVEARAGDTVLELGCGAGVASLCLAHRVSGVVSTGVEVQPDYADLARRNAVANESALTVIEADLAKLPADLRQQTFDHVIANPPYFTSWQGTGSADPGKERAFREDTPLATWVDTAIRRLKPKGYLTFIHLAERLPDLLGCLDGRVGSLEVKPLAARMNRPTGRIVLRARKGGNASFRLHAPLILHEGTHHDGDRDSYTAEARAILREGSSLSF